MEPPLATDALPATGDIYSFGILRRAKLHHHAVGFLYEIDGLSDAETELINSSNRNYRLGMAGVRVLSVV